MSSAAEAEIEASYMNGQDYVALRQCLIELGHPQPQHPSSGQHHSPQLCKWLRETEKIQIH